MSVTNRSTHSRQPIPYRKAGSAAYSSSLAHQDHSTLAVIATGALGLMLLWWVVPEFAWSGWAWAGIALTLGYAAIRGHEKLVRWRVLTSPRLMPERVGHPGWTWFRYTGWGGDRLPAYLLESENKSSELVLALHGWGSCAGRIEQRMLHMHDQGMHVLAPDMRGHGSAGLREEWTGLKMLADIELLLDSFQSDAKRLGVERIHIYGHSMGGFLALRLASHQSGWWKGMVGSAILESPVTSFPLLIKIIHPGPLGRLLLPLTRKAIRNEYERIHPDLNVRWDGAQVPNWGIPDLPVLVLQAGGDKRIGNAHLNRLTPHLPADAVVQVLTTLDHSSLSDSPERRELLETFLSERFGIGVGSNG